MKSNQMVPANNVERLAWLPSLLVASAILPGSAPRFAEELEQECYAEKPENLNRTLEDLMCSHAMLIAVEEVDEILMRMISQESE